MCKLYVMTYNSYSYKRGVTGFIKRPNPCVLLSHDLLYTKTTLHINLHIELMFFPGVIKNPKNQRNPLSTSKDMHRTSFNIGNKLLLNCRL